MTVRPRTKDSKTVAEIRLEKSSDPVWVTYWGKEGEKKTEFYIRASNTTQLLNPKEASEYIINHWKYG
jgi:hypothetical protein